MNGMLPSYEECVDLTRHQARQLDELRTEVERLKAELEPFRRAGKRQAAPFSKGSPKPDPKQPGCKVGHPPSHRPAPLPEPVDRTIEVPMPPECPGFHATLGEAAVDFHDPCNLRKSSPTTSLPCRGLDAIRTFDGFAGAL